jgi:hypothetical protein
MAVIRALQFAIGRSLSPVSIKKLSLQFRLKRNSLRFLFLFFVELLPLFFQGDTAATAVFLLFRFFRLIDEKKKAGAKASETQNHLASWVFCLEPRNSPVHVRTRGEVDAHTWPFSTREAGDT